MRILFLHNNFPGQYRRLVNALVQDPSIEMLAATLSSNQQQVPIRRVLYEPHRDVTQTIHPAAASMERAAITAQAAFRSLAPVKAQGWTPDIICAHSGWGPSMFLKELWPTAKLLPYFEWYYHGAGTDADFLDPGSRTENDRVRTHSKNAPILFDLAGMDWGVCPTRWQRSQFPEIFRDRISVAHDGVDIDYLKPDPEAELVLESGTLSREDEVVTYVARGMEPYRGFPTFMQAVALLQARRPKLHVVVVGSDGVSYGAARKDGKTFKEVALEEHDLDLDRLHFTGLVPFKTFRAAVQVSRAHIYLTVPFVLSWSMMEAMACGAPVVASDTAPVREVITDGRNGFLVDFFDAERIAERVEDVLDNRVDTEAVREAARATILERYAAQNLVRVHRQLILDVANGTLPPRPFF